MLKADEKVNVPSSGTISLPTVLPTARKPKCSDNFCQQECQDSPTQGAQCTCRDGYLLKPDKVSCQGKTAVLLNFYLDFVYSVSILQVNLAFVTAASYTQAPKGGAKACSELVFVFSKHTHALFGQFTCHDHFAPLNLNDAR